MAPERVIELTIFADGEIVKDTDILNPYFAELGETGHKLEDAVQSHLEQRGLTPTRRFDSDRGFYDVSVKGTKRSRYSRSRDIYRREVIQSCL
jgi:hypothetical protein